MIKNLAVLALLGAVNAIELSRLRQYPGVTFVQSDPIHGSLGPPPPPAAEDLTPEQQFELKQRGMRPLELEDSEEVVDTHNSVKVAEGIVGAKMTEPSDPEELAKLEKSPKYKLHTSEDEDEDTKETRRSVKLIEKREKRRFWINAREKRDFDAGIADGSIDPKQANPEEGDDEDVGKPDAKDQADIAANQDEAAAAAATAEAEAGMTEGEKKEAEAEADMAEADADAKAGEDDLPPELAGAAIQTKLEEFGVYPSYN